MNYVEFHLKSSQNHLKNDYKDVDFYFTFIPKQNTMVNELIKCCTQPQQYIIGLDKRCKCLVWASTPSGNFLTNFCLIQIMVKINKNDHFVDCQFVFEQLLKPLNLSNINVTLHQVSYALDRSLWVKKSPMIVRRYNATYALQILRKDATITTVRRFKTSVRFSNFPQSNFSMLEKPTNANVTSYDEEVFHYFKTNALSIINRAQNHALRSQSLAKQPIFNDTNPEMSKIDYQVCESLLRASKTFETTHNKNQNNCQHVSDTLATGNRANLKKLISHIIKRTMPTELLTDDIFLIELTQQFINDGLTADIIEKRLLNIWINHDDPYLHNNNTYIPKLTSKRTSSDIRGMSFDSEEVEVDISLEKPLSPIQKNHLPKKLFVCPNNFGKSRFSQTIAKNYASCVKERFGELCTGTEFKRLRCQILLDTIKNERTKKFCYGISKSRLYLDKDNNKRVLDMLIARSNRGGLKSRKKLGRRRYYSGNGCIIPSPKRNINHLTSKRKPHFTIKDAIRKQRMRKVNPSKKSLKKIDDEFFFRSITKQYFDCIRKGNAVDDDQTVVGFKTKYFQILRKILQKAKIKNLYKGSAGHRLGLFLEQMFKGSLLDRLINESIKRCDKSEEEKKEEMQTFIVPVVVIEEASLTPKSDLSIPPSISSKSSSKPSGKSSSKPSKSSRKLSSKSSSKPSSKSSSKPSKKSSIKSSTNSSDVSSLPDVISEIIYEDINPLIVESQEPPVGLLENQESQSNNDQLIQSVIIDEPPMIPKEIRKKIVREIPKRKPRRQPVIILKKPVQKKMKRQQNPQNFENKNRTKFKSRYNNSSLHKLVSDIYGDCLNLRMSSDDEEEDGMRFRNRGYRHLKKLLQKERRKYLFRKVSKQRLGGCFNKAYKGSLLEKLIAESLIRCVNDDVAVSSKRSRLRHILYESAIMMVNNSTLISKPKPVANSVDLTVSKNSRNVSRSTNAPYTKFPTKFESSPFYKSVVENYNAVKHQSDFKEDETGTGFKNRDYRQLQSLVKKERAKLLTKGISEGRLGVRFDRMYAGSVLERQITEKFIRYKSKIANGATEKVVLRVKDRDLKCSVVSEAGSYCGTSKTNVIFPKMPNDSIRQNLSSKIKDSDAGSVLGGILYKYIDSLPLKTSQDGDSLAGLIPLDSMSEIFAIEESFREDEQNDYVVVEEPIQRLCNNAAIVAEHWEVENNKGKELIKSVNEETERNYENQSYSNKFGCTHLTFDFNKTGDKNYVKLNLYHSWNDCKEYNAKDHQKTEHTTDTETNDAITISGLEPSQSFTTESSIDDSVLGTRANVSSEDISMQSIRVDKEHIKDHIITSPVLVHESSSSNTEKNHRNDTNTNPSKMFGGSSVRSSADNNVVHVSIGIDELYHESYSQDQSSTPNSQIRMDQRRLDAANSKIGSTIEVFVTTDLRLTVESVAPTGMDLIVGSCSSTSSCDEMLQERLISCLTVKEMELNNRLFSINEYDVNHNLTNHMSDNNSAIQNATSCHVLLLPVAADMHHVLT